MLCTSAVSVPDTGCTAGLVMKEDHLAVPRTGSAGTLRGGACAAIRTDFVVGGLIRLWAITGDSWADSL